MTTAPQERTVARDLLVIGETPGAPITCDLTGAADTAEERIAEYGRLFVHALVARDRSTDAVEFAFAKKPGVAAGPAAQATLDEFYAGPERFGDGMAGLLERLAGRGFAVSAPGPGRLAVDERPAGVLSRIKAACGC